MPPLQLIADFSFIMNSKNVWHSLHKVKCDINQPVIIIEVL